MWNNNCDYCRMDVTILREALQTVPNHNCELIVKAIAEKLAQTLGEQVFPYSAGIIIILIVYLCKNQMPEWNMRCCMLLLWSCV